jgi:K+ transporter
MFTADDHLEGRPAACSTKNCCARMRIDLPSFLEAVFVSPPTRVEGTAVFLTAEPGTVPNALLHNLKHNKVLHDNNLFVTVRNHEVPWIGHGQAGGDRVAGPPVLAGHGPLRLQERSGCAASALEQHQGAGLRAGPDDNQLFPVARHRSMPSIGSGMAQWREKLFCADAPQRQWRRRLPQAAEQLGGRTRDPKLKFDRDFC